MGEFKNPDKLCPNEHWFIRRGIDRHSGNRIVLSMVPILSEVPSRGARHSIIGWLVTYGLVTVINQTHTVKYKWSVTQVKKNVKKTPLHGPGI